MGDTRLTPRSRIRLAAALAGIALLVLLLWSAADVPTPGETSPGRDPERRPASAQRLEGPPASPLSRPRRTGRDWNRDSLEDPAIDRRSDDADFLTDAPFYGPPTKAAIVSGGSTRSALSIRGRRLRPDTVGGGRTESSVDIALAWLADHQEKDGSWNPEKLRNTKTGYLTDGGGRAVHRVGVTAAALMAFTGAGETHKIGDHRQTVKMALKFLKVVQEPDGRYGPGESEAALLGHIRATHAMADAYALTGSPLFKQSLASAAKNLVERRADDGGWRRNEDAASSDTDLTIWALLALDAANRSIPKLVADDVFAAGLAWLGDLTDGPTGLVFSTRHAGYDLDRDLWLTAGAAFARTMITESSRSDALRMAAEQCQRRLPAWEEGRIDVALWHLGTSALFQLDGPAWRSWNEAMKEAVIGSQRKDGDERGSWDPVGPWTDQGGRVWSTAMLQMCLEVYYRYDRVRGR